MFNRKPKSLRRTVAVAVFRAVLCTAGVAYGVSQAPVNLDMAKPESTTTAVAEVREAKVERLLKSNDCSLPEGVIPGHSVVTVDGKTKVASGDIGFAIWLGEDGEERTGDEAPGIVHGFCR